MSGGDIKAGIIGAITAGAFYGIGTHFQGLKNAAIEAGKTGLSAAQRVGKVIAHGAVGGVSSVARGGEFLAGFASASVTQAFSKVIDSIDKLNQGISAARTAAAVVGGGAGISGGAQTCVTRTSCF